MLASGAHRTVGYVTVVGCGTMWAVLRGSCDSFSKLRMLPAS